MRLFPTLAAAALAALALAVPATAMPQGVGLPIAGEHHSTCNGVAVIMDIPAGGDTFWIYESENPSAIPLGHYLIQRFTVTYGGVSTPYFRGVKAAFGDAINCVGSADGYGIDSWDVLVG